MRDRVGIGGLADAVSCVPTDDFPMTTSAADIRSSEIWPEDIRAIERVAGCMKRTNERLDFDELVSDGLFGLAQAWSKGTIPPPSNPARTTYVMRVARNKMVDGLRTLYGRPGTNPVKGFGQQSRLYYFNHEGDDNEQHERTDEALLDHQTERDIAEVVAEDMLSRLDERQATIVRRHYIEGEPLASIGADFGITESRTWQIDNEGLCRIKRSLENAWEPSDSQSSLRETMMSLLDGQLSEREFDTLRLSAEGKTVTEIAAVLGLGVETVKTYRRRVLAKLNAVNIAQAVALGYQKGILRIEKTGPPRWPPSR